MSLSLRNLVKNASYTIVGNLGTAVIAFFQSILVTRALGPSKYGIWGIVLSFTTIVTNFLSFRTGEPLTRYLVEYRKQKDNEALEILIKTTLLTEIATKLVSYVVILVLSPLILKYMIGDSSYWYLIFLYGSTVLFSFTDTIWYCVVRDQRRFRLIAAIPFISTITQFTVIILLWKLRLLDFTAYSTLVSAIAIAGSIFNIVYTTFNLRKHYGIHLFRIDIKGLMGKQSILSGFWSFMKTTYVSSSFTTFAKNADMMIISYFTNVTNAGVYRLAKSLISLLQQIGNALSSVIYQDLNELIRDGEVKEAERSIRKLMKYWIPLVAGGLLAAAVVSPFAIELVYGSKYKDAFMIFDILLLGAGFSISFFWTGPAIYAVDEYKSNLKLLSTLSVVGVLLMLLGTYLTGITGMAIAQSLFWFSIYTGQLLLLKKKVVR